MAAYPFEPTPDALAAPELAEVYDSDGDLVADPHAGHGPGGGF